ncbi:hypothetical protein [Streptomyces sp. NPDC056165]|uniref:hypothetical protein n=1 Tax=Streptomyces sp. NPDC056165 TaxID=3345733 RepID=UPI0035DA8854
MTHNHALDGHDEMQALLAAGLDAEPPLRSGTVDAAVAAGRRRRGTRMATRVGVGVAATAAVAAVVGYPTGGATPGPDTTTVAADPLVGPLTLAGSTSAGAKPLRPDSFGSGSGQPTGWSSEKLGNTLAALLPAAGSKTVTSGEFPGRTFRVVWRSAAGPVEFHGGAEWTADAPKVPFCATIALPKFTPRPGAPSPQEVAPRTDCQVVKLPDGARGEAMTLTFPQDGEVSQYVRVERADGRTVVLQQWAGKPGAALKISDLVKIADNSAWRF